MLAVLCIYEGVNVKEDNDRANATQQALEGSGAQYRACNAITAHFFFWPLVAVVMVLDLASKEAVFNWLEQKPGNSVTVINGFLKLVMVLNDGALFGLFSGHRYKLIAASTITIILILFIYFRSKTQKKSFYVSLGMLAGAACGLLYDRIFNDGLVRDFIDVHIRLFSREYHWPAFNIADAMLCIGVGLMLISVLWEPERSEGGSTGKPFRRRGQRQK